nr:zinc finger CCCH domain-containing protein 65 isoform X4 [Ipomoea batatas]
MKNCSELDMAKPSQNAFHFPPPHRRRPLMGETYCTLIHILSHCPAGCEPQPSQQKQESGKETTAHGGLVDQHTEAEIKLVSDIDHEKNKSDAIWQEMGDISDGQIKDCIDLLDHIDDAIEVNGEVPQKNGGNNGISSSLVDHNQASTLVLQLYKEQEDKSNALEVHVGESDLVQVQKMDKKISVYEACATIESCFMDEDNEVSLLVQGSEEKSHAAEKNLLEGMEHGLQLKEMELKNLISASGAANSSVHDTVVEEIEEGEISGDAGVSDESDSNMFEDTVSLEQGHTHKDVETKKIDGFDNVVHSEIVNGQVDGRNVDSFAACLPLKAVSLENATKSTVQAHAQGFLCNMYLTKSKASVANEGKRKKKRDPITKERRAKKKCKERIKRAQKNIKLGVKRLKLPPIVKPKTVSYCRHYQKGRCQEGEKCKFSHDIIPLTKSKPCRHFARHSCMKGDDCPFDHQLSKYPCNNFVSNGFCSRGVDCLFLHKVPAKTESSATSIVSKAELKSPLLPSSLSQKMQVNAHGSSQLFPGKSTGHTVGETVQKLAVRAPKGVSFLTHEKLPVGETNDKELGSSLKEGDSGKFNPEEIHSKLDNTQKPNDVIKGPTSRIPQGINFLSFGRVPLADPSSKTIIPNLFNRDYRIGKLQLGEFSKGKEDTASSPSSGDSCRNEMTTRTPPKSMPRGLTLLSFDKVSSDVTSSTEQAIICNKEYKIASPVVQGIQGSLSRLGGSREIQFMFASSSFPSNQLLGQCAVEHSEGLIKDNILGKYTKLSTKAKLVRELNATSADLDLDLDYEL